MRENWFVTVVDNNYNEVRRYEIPIGSTFEIKIDDIIEVVKVVKIDKEVSV